MFQYFNFSQRPETVNFSIGRSATLTMFNNGGKMRARGRYVRDFNADWKFETAV
jgi:hypothetical protein